MYKLPDEIQSIIKSVAKALPSKTNAYLCRNWAWFMQTNEQQYAHDGSIHFLISGPFNKDKFYHALKQDIVINHEISNDDQSYYIASDPFLIKFDIFPHLDLSNVDDVRKYASFSFESFVYDIREEKVIDHFNGIQHLLHHTPIIKSLLDEWDTQHILQFASSLATLLNSHIDNDDLQKLSTYKLLELKEPVIRTFESIMMEIMLANRPGRGIQFILSHFEDGPKWLFLRIVDLASSMNIPLDEDVDISLLSSKKIQLIDVYNEFFLENKSLETEPERYHRLTTTLRLLFDSPTLSIPTPYVENIAVLSKEDVKAFSTQRVSTRQIRKHADPCDYGPCPECIPDDCDPQCCCCISYDYVYTIRSRCHKQITISCNSDGTSPGPGLPAFGGGSDGEDACDIVLGDVPGSDCSNLPEQPWWQFDPTAVCSCECIQPSGGDCDLTCATCANIFCTSDVAVTSGDCAYRFTLTPGSTCCGDSLNIPTSCDCYEEPTQMVVRSLPQCQGANPPDECFQIPIQRCLPNQTDCNCELPWALDVCGETVVVVPTEVNMICCGDLPGGGCSCDDGVPIEGCCGVDCPGSEVCNPDGSPAYPSLEAAQNAVWCNCWTEKAYVVTEGCVECCCPQPDGVPGDVSYPCDQLDPNDPAEKLLIDSGQCCNCPTANTQACCNCCIQMPGETNPVCRDSILEEVSIAYSACVDEPEPPIEIQPPDPIECKDDECIVGEPVGPVSDDQCANAHLGCTSVRNPSTVILNNGIGLVAYESMENISVIKIQQFSSSVVNKIMPNREFNYGRLENQSKWTNGIAKFYVYEDLSEHLLDSTTDPTDPSQWSDSIFFNDGPLEKQFFPLASPPTAEDDIGKYVAVYVGGNPALTNPFPSNDDVYNIRWFIYDREDQGLIGDAEDDTTDGKEFIISSRQVVDEALMLSPHIYNGEAVPVARPSIATAYNYQNALENSHFVYLTYEAFEDEKWNVYLRQLRLSEYDRQGQIDEEIEDSSLVSIVSLGIENLIYKVVCVHDACTTVGDATTATRQVVMEVLLQDGRDILNAELSGQWSSLCPGTPSGEFPKEKVFASMTHVAVADSCPDQFGFNEVFYDWQVGDEFLVPAAPIPSIGLFTAMMKAGDSSVGVGEFSPPLQRGGVSVTSATVDAIWYDNIQVTTWSVISSSGFETLSKYKGLDIGEPILLTPNERGHCTRPVVKVNYNNDVFVVYETTEDSGLQEVVLVGTNSPLSSLPNGVFSARDLDASLNYFYKPSDFVYRQQLTFATEGINQLPDLFIDFNDVVHIAWQSNRDNYWEIYYASSETSFLPKRITDFQSKSLKPSITGDEVGNLFIAWHDDRFGNWEVMMAYLSGARILPLAQQDPYLASVRNTGYSHVTGVIPLQLANTGNVAACYTDITVSFFEDRLLQIPAFSVSQGDWPFAFTIPGADPYIGTTSQATTQAWGNLDGWEEDNPSLPGFSDPAVNALSVTSTSLYRLCLGPGGTATAYLDLTPDIRIDKEGAETESIPLPVAFAQNNTYFISVTATDSDGVTQQMPTQFLSVSCESCTDAENTWNDISCSVKVNIPNENVEKYFYNAQFIFYSDIDKLKEVARFDAFPGNEDLSCFTVDNSDQAASLWTSRGLAVSPGEQVNLVLWPSLSPTAGLLCGIPYYVDINICSKSESEGGTCVEGDLTLYETIRWTCNCASARWDPRFENAPINIRLVSMWNSSGEGGSDTRLTETHYNNINPQIKLRSNRVGVILYETDRPDDASSDPGVYKIYASIFSMFPALNMYASAAQSIISPFEFIVHKSDIPICENQGCYDSDNNHINDTLLGRNVSFDIDQYNSLFVSLEQSENQQDCHEFAKDRQQIIRVHRCGSDDKDLFKSVSSTDISDCRTPDILGVALPAPDSKDTLAITQLIRIDNKYVKYHVSRGGTSMPVIDNCNVELTVIGTPDTIAIRLQNEDGSSSPWLAFEPEVGENTMVLDWELSPGSGLKTIQAAVATNAGVSDGGALSVVADYTKVVFDIRFFRAVDSTPVPPDEVSYPTHFTDEVFSFDNQFNSLDGLPVASLRRPTVENSEIVNITSDYIFVEIIPESGYMQLFTDEEKETGAAAPVFDLVQQGGADQFNLQTFYTRRSDTNEEVFRGVVRLSKDDSSLNLDGLAVIVPHFKKDCSDTGVVNRSSVEYVKDQYNFIVPGSPASIIGSSDVWSADRDEFGQIQYKVTIRPTDDPYFVFGDPNYGLHRDDSR